MSTSMPSIGPEPSAPGTSAPGTSAPETSGSETPAVTPAQASPVVAGVSSQTPPNPPPIDPLSAAVNDAAFGEVVKLCRLLKEQYVDKRIDYYKHHTLIPRAMFRSAGVLTIIFSVTLPALAAAVFPYKEVILSVISISIAALTGLSSFYRWDKTWSGNSSSQVALEQHVAKWELELTNAQYLLAPAERNLHVYKATNDLLINASNVVSSESTGFFSGLQFPQQTTTAKTQG